MKTDVNPILTDSAPSPVREHDPDGALVARCLHELPYNTSGFAELVRRHEFAVHQLCAQYLNNDHDAEEVTQDVFLKVFRALPRFEGRSTFRTWLYRIAVNACSSRYRRHQRRRARDDAFARESLGDENAVAQPLEAGVDEDGGSRMGGPVGLALETLSETDREVLVLRHITELPLQEIATALGLGLSATKMRLYRAEERFRGAYAVAVKAM